MSSSPNVRRYGSATPLLTTSIPMRLSPLNFCPAINMSFCVNESVRLIFFTRSTSLAASYCSSALRLATSLSAASPCRRDDCRRGAGESSSFTRFGGALFLVFVESLFVDFPALANLPAGCVSCSSFKSAFCSAMFACRCLSISDRAFGLSIAIFDQ